MTLVPFDDRDGWIWFDGALVPWREARPHVLSHGLHYASAVFEGERAYAGPGGGRIFALRAHTERLLASGRLLGFGIPWDAAAIDAACEAVLARNGLRDAYLRPIAWRGSEQIAVSARATRIHLAIAAWEWPNLFGAARARGVRLAMAEWRRPPPEAAPTAAKAAGHYMTGTLSKHAAEEAGCDDALMLGWRGQLAEATGANLFLVIDGALHTPTPDCFLDGITRRAVMDLARRRRIRVVERAIMPGELALADEAFLTGTAAEVTPVREIAGRAYAPGRITETLMADYAALVRGADETDRADQRVAAVRPPSTTSSVPVT
ncbi:branched-chain amino acid aminotransferase [Roseomonas sp. NAR14]|uniref:Branched-chain-amino-acid aminotransferase n=1 Tax=Roseomonas acroporae TaxID=2937791 RepID=A0A9X2BVR6_9PROT|nr:branched-chain amino acid aminotransferase [Roseomonas acroporae]MCK8785381.1 branched-chain amino acid aminotransferase [Roseomonas acroporae]